MILSLEQTDSTNSYMKAHSGRFGHADAVTAKCQSAGRGQKGNKWESEPGRNLTVSVMIVPEEAGVAVHAARSFPISQAVALAVSDLLCELLPADQTMTVGIKWPNDIYVGDRKIAGILIENSLAGAMVGRSIAGIGLNVNQHRFYSDAPNPVSLIQLTDREYDIDHTASRLVEILSERFAMIGTDPAGLHADYMARLWRGTGCQRFIDVVSGREFVAEVAGVAESGHITLRRVDGSTSVYAFKEIVWVM